MKRLSLFAKWFRKTRITPAKNKLKTSGRPSSSFSKLARTQLPNTSYLASSHVLVNCERLKGGLDSLNRSRYMDDFARVRAEKMAEAGRLFKSNKKELQELLKSKDVGQISQRGLSVRSLHAESLSNANSTHLFSRTYTEFGVGTAKGSDGILYMVQLFRGRSAATSQPFVI